MQSTNANFEGGLEAEIAELENLIQKKRSQLEQKVGLVEEGTEKELVHAALAEKIYNSGAPAVKLQTTTASSGQLAGQGKSYLEYLDKESATTVSSLISLIEVKGINEAIKQARVVSQDDAFILDAFHDAAAEYLYQKLVGKK